MPSLSASFNPAIGPLINLFLTPPAFLHQAIQSGAGSPAAPIAVHATPALIDTGASMTSITAQVAQIARLPLIGKRNVGTAGGTVAANVYLADIAIPFGALPPLALGQPTTAVLAQAATIANVTILEFQCASPHFNMLLGRDILCRGVFTFSFDNRYTFSI